MQYRAAIVGCGRIAGQLDDDPRRQEIWTHAGAYHATPQVRLVAAADIVPDRLAAFGARWQVPYLYHDYRHMLRTERPDLLSICTHSPLHLEMVEAGVEAGVKAIFCEKPLAASLAEADRLVNLCARAGVVLAVNHTRRWEPLYRLIQSQRVATIGPLQGLTAYYTGGLANMGSHLCDFLRFLGGEVRWVRADRVCDPAGGDPDVTGCIGFADGFVGTVHGLHQTHYFVFEIDLLGTRGRLRISHNGAQVEAWEVQESERYTGYQELRAAKPLACHDTTPRLVAAIEDILRCVERGGVPLCSGQDGRAALEMVAAFHQSWRQGGSRVDLPLVNRQTPIPST